MFECLQVLDNGRRLHLADAANATKQAFSGVAKGISSAFMLPFQTLQNAFKLAPPALPDSAERQPVRIKRQPKGTSMETGPLPAGATVTIRVRTSENGSHEASPVEDRMAGATPYIHLGFHTILSLFHAQPSQTFTHIFTASNLDTSCCQKHSVSLFLHNPLLDVSISATLVHDLILSDPCTLLLELLALKDKGAICCFVFIKRNTLATKNVIPDISAFAGNHLAAAEALVAGTKLATKQQPNPASNDLLDEDMSPLKRGVPAKSGRNQQSLTSSLPITDGIVQFAGEREMWASFQDANLRKRRRLKMLAGGAMLLVCASWWSIPLHPWHMSHPCLHL